MMTDKVNYSLYKCPYEHLKKDCGHELHGAAGCEDIYGVWCACGFRGPAFYTDPADLRLIKGVRMRIKVSSDRIEGWCNMPSWNHEQRVIVFDRKDGTWYKAISMSLPVNIEEAKIVQACYATAFAELEKR